MLTDAVGAFLVSERLIPQMLENGGGVIVNTSSISGFVADGGGAAYTASKHGVIGLTRQLASDYGPKGVRANAICPGVVVTGTTEEVFSDPAALEKANAVPAGRYANPKK